MLPIVASKTVVPDFRSNDTIAVWTDLASTRGLTGFCKCLPVMHSFATLFEETQLSVIYSVHAN